MTEEDHDPPREEKSMADVIPFPQEKKKKMPRELNILPTASILREVLFGDQKNEPDRVEEAEYEEHTR